LFFFFSSRRRHTRFSRDWSSDVCSSDLGQLNGEDIMEIIQDDVDSTMKNLAGVSQDEELFAPILTSAKSRSIWLGINLCTALLAAAVIGQFEAVLAKVVALAILMPVDRKSVV